MSTETNKATVRRWITEGWNKGNLSLVDEMYTPDFVQHDPGSPVPVTSHEALKGYVTVFRTAIPDLQFTIDDLVAEADKVLWRFTARGTQTGALMAIPPTGRSATVTGMVLFRFANGKIAEVWVNVDNLGLLQQLGVVPAMA